MRLIKTEDLTLIEVPGDYSGRYAILSHTWEDGEISHQEMQMATRYKDQKAEAVKKKQGYQKIRNFATVAGIDGFHYIWVDTCCIDKTSSAELSEAINSMYRWYKNASRCYVYLADVPPGPLPVEEDVPYQGTSSTGHPFYRSRWLTRGWTLQELIAPTEVVFYYSDLTPAFTKSQKMKMLAWVTNIPESVLETGDCSSISVAGRMRWAANRTTTRIEDIAYCLLGIFDINMPLLYGEAEGAFLRLQEEICRTSDDQTIFAWQQIQSSPDGAKQTERYRGLFARSPKEFAVDPDWFEPNEHSDFIPPFGSTSIGFNAQFPLIRLTQVPELLLNSISPKIRTTGKNAENEYLAILSIKTHVANPRARLVEQRDRSNHGLAILLKALSPDATRQFVRVDPSTLFRFGLAQGRVVGLLPAEPASLYVRHRIRIPKNHISRRWGGFVIERSANWPPENMLWLPRSKEYHTGNHRDLIPVSRSSKGPNFGKVMGVIIGSYPGPFVIYFGSGPSSTTSAGANEDGLGPPIFWVQRGDINESFEEKDDLGELVRSLQGIALENNSHPWTILGFRTGVVNISLSWLPKLVDDMLVCSLSISLRIDN